MVDQLFMRQWVMHHDKFTEDMHLALGKILALAGHALKRRLGMSKTYGTRKLLSAPTSQSIVAGFAASAMTLVLFAGTWAVSVPTLAYA